MSPARHTGALDLGTRFQVTLHQEEGERRSDERAVLASSSDSVTFSSSVSTSSCSSWSSDQSVPDLRSLLQRRGASKQTRSPSRGREVRRSVSEGEEVRRSATRGGEARRSTSRGGEMRRRSPHRREEGRKRRRSTSHGEEERRKRRRSNSWDEEDLEGVVWESHSA